MTVEVSNLRPSGDDGPVNYGRIILALVIYKLGYLLAMAATAAMAKTNLGTIAIHWDSWRYLAIATDGYKPGDQCCGFWPLFPWIIRFLSTITGISLWVMGLVTANVFSLAAWFIFFILIREKLGTPTAKLALILLVAFPSAMFFQVIYTESLFLLLVMLLVLGLKRNWFWLVALAAFLLPLTRAVGLFCIFPLFWHLMTTTPPPWLRTLIAGILKRKWGVKNESAAQAGHNAPVPVSPSPTWQPGVWFLLLAPLCGWGVYLLVLQHATGNAFEGYQAQKALGMQSTGNIFNVVNFVFAFFRPTGFHEIRGSLLDRCAFLLFAYSLPLIWRLDKTWVVWSLFLGVVPAMSGMFTSYTRYVLVVFPLFVAMAVFLNKPGRLFWSVRLVIITIFALLQFDFLWRYIVGLFAG